MTFKFTKHFESFTDIARQLLKAVHQALIRDLNRMQSARHGAGQVVALDQSEDMLAGAQARAASKDAAFAFLRSNVFCIGAMCGYCNGSC